MGLSGGGGDGGAAQARADEQARQQRIREGTDKINNIFDGYTKTFGEGLVDPAAYTPGTKYYTAEGQEYLYNPPPPEPQPNIYGGQPTSGKDSVYPNAAPQTSRGGDKTPAQLFASAKTETVPGQFGDEFYSGRKNAYLDYATPQLNDQYSEAQKQLAFSLDRSGLLDSSVRAQKEADLRRLYDQNRQQVADQGLNYETTARSNVEDARSNLIAMLNSTGDVEGAVNAANARAKALSASDTYSPLANLFSSFTGTLGQQAALEKSAALANSYSSGGTTGLFGTNKKSVKTTA